MPKRNRAHIHCGPAVTLTNVKTEHNDALTWPLNGQLGHTLRTTFGSSGTGCNVPLLCMECGRVRQNEARPGTGVRYLADN